MNEPVDQLGRPQADPAPIIHSLVEHGVRFLLAGGMAVQAHGYVRITLDVDIVPSPDQANMARLAAALKEMDAAAVDDRGNRLPLDLSHPESLALRNYFLVTRHGALDLFNGSRPDLKRFRSLDDASLEITFEGLRVRVIGKDDLIAMKREAGRPKDLEDIAALTEAERRRDELAD